MDIAHNFAVLMRTVAGLMLSAMSEPEDNTMSIMFFPG